ncbi:MAG: 1-deoxy-D-xylulose-5-phosphate synthase [Alphaproteobacteria bacterium]|nr:1-deoxy-D-xylulose-5-phosphate synthase [Alphaproteobacteria bacterium]
MLLDRINSSNDVKKLNIDEMNELAKEIRLGILNRTSKIGGHVSPNLGIVETTIALHYVFDTPKDKIVFDVSHQCYAHKIITGRKEGFFNEAYFDKISGFTAPLESEYDTFVVGHTSTSVSLACGLAQARDAVKGNERVIALIGDGSLSGGEALEGLDFAGEMKTGLIIIVNDNEMSIAENHGGLYKNLQLLRETKGKAECNLFKAMGLEYTYLEEGNNIKALIDTFEKIKDTKVPVIVHIHTNKGQGYLPADQYKEMFHFNMPFDVETGQSNFDFSKENYNSLTANYLMNKVKEDEKVYIFNAGTPGALTLTPDKRAILGKHFIDVGIAEEHAVAMVSAMAKRGAKPVLWLLSSFIQRTYDQLSQDLALNNSPAVIIVGWAGINSADMTHLGLFDMTMMSNIPNLVCLSPSNKEEYLAMLDWAIDQNKHPVVIRLPQTITKTNRDVKTDFDNINTYEVVEKGSDIAILALGQMFELGQNVANALKQNGKNPTLINPRFYSDVDEKTLTDLLKNHSKVITLEDGSLSGGFGEKIARFFGPTSMKVFTFGANKEFNNHVPLDELFKKYHLSVDEILKIIL